MLPFGVTIPATVPQWSEIPEGLMNYPVLILAFVYDAQPLLSSSAKSHKAVHNIVNDPSYCARFRKLYAFSTTSFPALVG
jgi:hypothetical protein